MSDQTTWPEAVVKAAAALRDLTELPDVARSDWCDDARTILGASGLIVERDEWKARAEKAGARLTRAAEDLDAILPGLRRLAGEEGWVNHPQTVRLAQIIGNLHDGDGPDLEIVRSIWTCMSCGCTGQSQSCGECGREARPGQWIRVADRDQLQEQLQQAREIADDFQALGCAFVTLYLQALNGVVCDPGAEPGRLGCKACLDAWKTGKEILSKHDPKWGNMYRSGPSFDPVASTSGNPDTTTTEPAE
jgi:hypothetical protein